MNREGIGVTLPSVSVVVPPDFSEEEVREVAADKISGLLKGKEFEMVAVDLLEEGDLHTSLGVIHGKRYLVSFQKKINVVYLHPDYLEIMADYTRRRGLNADQR